MLPNGSVCPNAINVGSSIKSGGLERVLRSLF